MSSTKRWKKSRILWRREHTQLPRDTHRKWERGYLVTWSQIWIVQTSDDAKAVNALQSHAAEVTDLVHGGMAALQTAMMKNHGGMMSGGMMHGPMMMRGMMHRGAI
jgi:hypothetical protein